MSEYLLLNTVANCEELVSMLRLECIIHENAYVGSKQLKLVFKFIRFTSSTEINHLELSKLW